MGMIVTFIIFAIAKSRFLIIMYSMYLEGHPEMVAVFMIYAIATIYFLIYTIYVSACLGQKKQMAVIYLL